MVKERHPAIAEMMITHLGGGTAPCFQAVRECQQSLEGAGLNIPSWRELAESHPVREAEPEPNQPKFGRQQKATRKLEQQFVREAVWPGLGDPTKALFRSQHGPLASAPLTAMPHGLMRNHSVSCCVADSTFPSPLTLRTAGVAAHWTSLATIVQRVLRLGCWGVGEEEVSFGVRCSAGLLGGWGSRCHKHVRQGHGPRRLQRVGQPQA